MAVRANADSEHLITAPQLPTELILEIVSYFIHINAEGVHTCEHRRKQTQQVFSIMARVCRGWNRAIGSYLYASTTPSDIRACRLLLRTLQNNPDLVPTVKSLTLPADDKLYFRTMISTKLTARRGRVIRELVAKCPNLTHLSIHMESAVWWEPAAIQTNFPAMSCVANITNLEIAGSKGPWAYPPPKRIVGFQHLAAWLCQVHMLPNLESLTLTEIVLSRTEGPIAWPEMPRLRHMRLNHPLWTAAFDDRLFLHVQGSLKSLHIFDTYQPYHELSSVFRPFDDQSSAVTQLLPHLEEFALVYDLKGTSIPRITRVATNVGQLTSLRCLCVSGFLVREKLLWYSRSSLETLVLVICGTVDMIFTNHMWEILPQTIKNVTLEVKSPEGWGCTLLKEAWLDELIKVSRLKAERLGVNLRVEYIPKPGVKLELKRFNWMIKHLSRFTKG